MSYEPLTSTEARQIRFATACAAGSGATFERWLIVHASDVRAYPKDRCSGLPLDGSSIEDEVIHCACSWHGIAIAATYFDAPGLWPG